MQILKNKDPVYYICVSNANAMRSRLLLLLLPCLSLFACKEKQKSSSAEEKTTQPTTTTGTPPVKVEDSSSTYFSISDYFDDQWKTRKGDPYTLLKITELKGKRDSAFVPLDSALWAQLRAPFDAADISDKKYLGWYKYDMFTDETTETLHLHYEAMAADLFMRQMDISADMFTRKVKSIYMETRREQEGHSVSQKLQYISDRLFQLQTFEKTEGKAWKNTNEQYRFQY